MADSRGGKSARVSHADINKHSLSEFGQMKKQNCLIITKQLKIHQLKGAYVLTHSIHTQAGNTARVGVEIFILLHLEGFIMWGKYTGIGNADLSDSWTMITVGVGTSCHLLWERSFVSLSYHE